MHKVVTFTEQEWLNLKEILDKVRTLCLSAGQTTTDYHTRQLLDVLDKAKDLDADYNPYNIGWAGEMLEKQKFFEKCFEVDAKAFEVVVHFRALKGTESSRVIKIEGPREKDLPERYRKGEHIHVAGKTVKYCYKSGIHIKDTLFAVGCVYSNDIIAEHYKIMKRCHARLKSILKKRRTGIVIKTQVVGEELFKILDIKALKWDQLPEEYRSGECVYLDDDCHLWYRFNNSRFGTAILLHKGHTYKKHTVDAIKRIVDRCGKRLQEINNRPKLKNWAHKYLILKIEQFGPDEFGVKEVKVPAGNLFEIKQSTNYTWLECLKTGAMVVTLNQRMSGKELMSIKHYIRQIFQYDKIPGVWRS